MYKKIIGLFCVALMVTLVGCGASHPPLTIVTGTVTYDGEPLADATVAITCYDWSDESGIHDTISVNIRSKDL